ncbi:MAG: putative rane protein [Pyrinomonadaceae bacterium]|nr:putative rane protein [Pyrinomonadaceae bacterium]
MDVFDRTAQSLYRASMWAGSWWCHQLPARSPHLWGAQLPLCWRCTGILVGTLALFGWLLWKRRVPPLRLSIALALLLPLDVLHAVVTSGEGNNARRLLTGVLWGIFGTSLFLRFVKRAAARLSPSSTPART